MANKSEIRPFGTLFEVALKYDGNVEPSSYYDEEQDLSLIIMQDGSKQVLVEAEFAARTKTETFQQQEREDDDDSGRLYGTHTGTNEKSGTSELNNTLYHSVATNTATSVKKEQTDQDSSPETFFGYSLGTQTATKADKEVTDSDYLPRP